MTSGLFYDPEDEDDMLLGWPIFNGLQGVIPQKTELFITIAVKTLTIQNLVTFE
jgi:hypothetical protein